MEKENKNVWVENFIKLFKNKIISWSMQTVLQNLIIAHKDLDKQTLPPGVKLVQKPIKGPRVINRSDRPYGYTSLTPIVWPKDGLHTTRFVQLICVLEGRAILQIWDKLLYIEEGHFILCPPDIPRGEPAFEILYNKSKKSIYKFDEYKLLWFTGFGNGVRSWISRYTDGKFYVFQPEENFFIINPIASMLLQKINEIIEKDISYFIANGSSLLTAFLQIIMFQLEQEGPIFPNSIVELSGGIRNNQNIQDPMLMAVNYIKSHLNEPLTMKDVAQHVYMSRSNFAKHFPVFIGKTFAQFLTEERLKTAKILLRDTEWSIKEISIIIGFKHPMSFFKMFKCQTGITPRNFRYQSRKQNKYFKRRIR
jgi:AraC-like DNA-binding protein